MKKCFKKLGSFVIVLTFVVGMLMTDAGAEDLASVLCSGDNRGDS